MVGQRQPTECLLAEIRVLRHRCLAFHHQLFFAQHEELKAPFLCDLYTAKVWIDSAGVLDTSTGFEEGKYLLLGDLSKLKNSFDDSKECIQDASILLTAQVKATSYDRAI